MVQVPLFRKLSEVKMLFASVVPWLLVLLKLILIECDYYSFDGADNNLEHPAWGSRDRPFQRILGESDYLSYSDGEGEIDDTLPNPRKISNIFHANDKPGIA